MVNLWTNIWCLSNHGSKVILKLHTNIILELSTSTRATWDNIYNIQGLVNTWSSSEYFLLLNHG